MKKALSLILALVMIMAVVPVNSFAAGEDKLVKNIELTLNPRVAGKNGSDILENITLNGNGVVIDENSIRATFLSEPFGLVEEVDVFEEGKRYTVKFNLYAEEGYLLPFVTDSVNVSYKVLKSTGTVDGGFDFTAENPYDDEHAEYYTVLIYFYAEEAEPSGIVGIIARFFEAIANFFRTLFGFRTYNETFVF